MTTTTGLVSDQILSRVKSWAPYVDAKLGFRNHWYPSVFSADVKEGEPVKIKLGGENLLLNRVEGKVYCMKDQCLHRGAPLSQKIDCRTKDTISCWYHGWTYRWTDGKLVDVISNPNSAVIGRRHIKTYPVQEAKGTVFVFLGDIEPTPLELDTPPGFLDDDVVALGMIEVVDANWRLGVENGMDATHVWLHKDANLVKECDIALPLGFAPQNQAGSKSFKVVTGDEAGGRAGVLNLLADGSMPVFEGKVEGESIRNGHMGQVRVADRLSLWMPGIMMVDPWPMPNMIQYEWRVPRDENSHYYIPFITKRCATPEEAEAFTKEFHEKWLPLALEDFNGDDKWAVEAVQTFYADDSGWVNELLGEGDIAITAWRKLASTHNRGLQSRANIAS